ncbi:glyoxalase [Alkalihalobacillus alcalophilus ATCC 27647 = CGMCC 1.3604]|uniref:Glyoxalase n=1 Tax=Alkalihalobacillus alcalophilus ATCC 27647 = CGMCC 1.3604 TaxID=1218173 RepID=A0A094WMF3_ALKAL|nr:VOC family protein [Alkalihalobacillus alcalophilus]KGA97138.1 glyoxalase [Alkalihalobacillus alcalophilus ATCC 27647 = CGMCC 1.3604]MED1560590.1 VOC family protein [Alkalihalobacillus alcalophilus]THG89065.1 glyoxalase [Alkalihalobacillus alcalophilus ATCC 27647 = CGMCC 1.3604]
MKLNHLNLTVTNVETAREFLETYFGMTCEGTRGNGFAAMFDEDGFVLTLMKGKSVEYPQTFHIGFPQESKEKVDEIYQRLKEDGFEMDPPIEAHGYTFYVQAPGGFTVEVLA